MAQAAFCSVSNVNGDHKAVCKTEYSYVLKRFHDLANDFHFKIDKFEQCLREGTSQIDCGKLVELDALFENALNREDSPLTVTAPLEAKMVNQIHDIVCRSLNEEAEYPLCYAKDINLEEYEVLRNSDNIKSILESLSFDIKVSTGESLVLTAVRDVAEFMSKNYDYIKQCFAEGTDDLAFNRCIETIISNDQNCGSLIHLPEYYFFLSHLHRSDLPKNIDKWGDRKEIDDVCLKMELRRCLDVIAKNHTNENGHYCKANIKFDEYFCDENLNENKVKALKTEYKEYVKWIWIKYIVGGVIIISVFAGIAQVYFKRKTSIKDEENMIELEDEIEHSSIIDDNANQDQVE